MFFDLDVFDEGCFFFCWEKFCEFCLFDCWLRFLPGFFFYFLNLFQLPEPWDCDSIWDVFWVASLDVFPECEEGVLKSCFFKEVGCSRILVEFSDFCFDNAFDEVLLCPMLSCFCEPFLEACDCCFSRGAVDKFCCEFLVVVDVPHPVVHVVFCCVDIS